MRFVLCFFRSASFYLFNHNHIWERLSWKQKTIRTLIQSQLKEYTRWTEVPPSVPAEPAEVGTTVIRMLSSWIDVMSQKLCNSWYSDGNQSWWILDMEEKGVSRKAITKVPPAFSFELSKEPTASNISSLPRVKNHCGLVESWALEHRPRPEAEARTRAKRDRCFVEDL